MKSDRFVYLGKKKRAYRGLTPANLVDTASDLPTKLGDLTDDSVLISDEPQLLGAFVKGTIIATSRSTYGDLLATATIPPALGPPVRNCFKRVIGGNPEFRWLPSDQLLDVLRSESKADLFIGGSVDQLSKTLTLTRGDRQTLVVPLSIFRKAGPAIPDFTKLEFDDYGNTVRFGADYEASAHGILLECDPDYRRRFNKQRLQTDQSFGASMRRLRLLRRKSRSNFPGINAKTIARIERGETEKPHGSTLSKIAKVLDVTPDEIESF